MIEFGLAGLLFVFGVVSAFRSITDPPTDVRGGDRVLIAIHNAAKAMFWLSLAGFFLAEGLSGGRADVRWLLLIPLGMAAVRLVSGAFVSSA